ncbi:hypothetical protein MXB_607 [Myxobolus squamalis]|nr:hypothetical protein MXB_607 [Myxobolus squamalis]
MSAIGFDFGNHSSYVAFVRTGGIETVDNEQSYRATPTAVSFTDLLRFTGNSAKTQAITNFRNTFLNFKNLIGLLYDDPIAKKEMSLISSKFLKMEDGTIGVEAQYLGNICYFSITQLVVMMLSDLKKTTLRHIPNFTSCVLSVPNYFSDTQRRCFLDACQVAGLDPLTLVSDTVAGCLDFMVFKYDLPADDQPARNIAFVNVGYSSTQVCIAAFNRSKLRVLASIGTSGVGGRMFDLCLYQKFSQEFQRKHNLDIESNRKAQLKLLAECESLKKLLNTTTSQLPLRIECLYNDIDFNSTVSRDELNELSAPIFSEFKGILESALNSSGLALKDIFAVEAVGGSSRVQEIKRIICSVFGQEVSVTLNADETVSRGCAIQCAILSPMVKIREIEIKDIIVGEYNVCYPSKNGDKKELKIFKNGEPIPTTKEIKFPPNIDSSFSVSYTDLRGCKTDIGSFRATSKITAECHPAKLVFYTMIDLSGIFNIKKAFFTEIQPCSNPEEPTALPLLGKNTEAKPKTTTVHHNLTVEFKYCLDYSEKIPEYQTVESTMIKQINLEKERSNSKNSLEEFIYSLREKIDPVYREHMTEDEVGSISCALSAEEDWLYTDGEFQATSVYVQHLSHLQTLFQPIHARYEGFTKSFASLDKMAQMLPHYRKFMDVYNQDPAKYDFISDEEILAYCKKVTFSDSYVNESFGILKNQPKTRLPSIPYQDIDIKTGELVSVCDRVIKKAQNPPPKPAEPQAQPDTSASDVTPMEEAIIDQESPQ